MSQNREAHRPGEGQGNSHSLEQERRSQTVGRAEGSLATGDRGPASMSCMPDDEGTGSGSCLDSVLSSLLKKKKKNSAGTSG